MIDDIRFQTKAKERIRLDDVYATKRKHNETDSGQFADARALNSAVD